MKKRILGLALTLLLAVSLLTPGAAAAPFDAYADAVKAAMAENGDELPGYGMLKDLDGDGTDELLMLYRARLNGDDEPQSVVLSVYTLRDGRAEALLDHRYVFDEVGGTSGEVSVVTRGEDTLLLVERTNPEPVGDDETERIRVEGDAALYQLQSGVLVRLSRLDYTRVDVLPEGEGDVTIAEEGFSCVEQTAHEQTLQRSVTEYTAWFDALERAAVLTLWDTDNTEDGMPLAYLLGRLQGRIGPFEDVPADTWYSDSVEWALLHGVTTGKTDTTFAPDETCTRAQTVTFLWRSHGSPRVLGEEGTPFTDVPQDAYYYEAVRWAVTLGVTTGTTETTFSPDDTVTRAQTVTFLWRDAAHRSAALPEFTDVPQDAYFAAAVGWAQENGVTTGMTETTFVPDGPCTRAQIVTFLSRAVCAPGLHAADLTGLDIDREPDFATDDVGKLILFTAVGDLEDFAFTTVMFTEDGELLPDTTVYSPGRIADGTTILLRTGIPDVAAHLAVRYTIGDRTVTLAIMDSGLDGSLYLTEI